MSNPQKAYNDLADWADVEEYAKEQFDVLLSNLVKGVMEQAIEETQQIAESGIEHVSLIKSYTQDRDYEQFFTLYR